jgi:hypothetical protein
MQTSTTQSAIKEQALSDAATATLIAARIPLQSSRRNPNGFAPKSPSPAKSRVPAHNHCTCLESTSSRLYRMTPSLRATAATSAQPYELNAPGRSGNESILLEILEEVLDLQAA